MLKQGGTTLDIIPSSLQTVIMFAEMRGFNFINLFGGVLYLTAYYIRG